MYKFMTCIWIFIDVYMFICFDDYPSYALMSICFLYKENHLLGMGNWEQCEEGEGPYELPPSRGWPYSVENNLFSKQREDH